MPNPPHRPFVPKHTTPERPGQRSGGEFRVVRPFVHGRAPSSEQQAPVAPEPKAVASIADFLAMDSVQPEATPFAIEPEAPASIADYLAGRDFEPAAYETESDSYDPPPIEHFTDTISEENAPAAGVPADSMMDPFAAPNEQPSADPYGWEETDWQRYDWNAAGALGDAGDPDAHSAWAETDWSKPGTTAKDSRESAAKAIADALDGIARRIREGDLVIPPPPASVPDPATIAATLAALLGVRR